MLKSLAFLFIVVPLAEIVVLVEVGSFVGVAGTLGLVVMTALAGALMVRQQGLASVRQIHTALSRGELPARAFYHAGFLLLAGALLLTPGFLTDTLGFLCLMPPVREQLGQWLIRHWLEAVTTGQGSAGIQDPIEGNFREVGGQNDPDLTGRLDKRD